MTRENRKTHDPYPRKPVPVATGMGFRGYGSGLAWDTPGLPVIFPRVDGLADDTVYFLEYKEEGNVSTSFNDSMVSFIFPALR